MELSTLEDTLSGPIPNVLYETIAWAKNNGVDKGVELKVAEMELCSELKSTKNKAPTLSQIKQEHSEWLLMEEKIKKQHSLLLKEQVKVKKKLLNHAAEERFKLEQENSSMRVEIRVLAEQYEEKDLSERVARELAEDLQKQVDVMNGEAQTLRRKHHDLDTHKMSLKAQLDKATSDADQFKHEVNDAKLEIAKKNIENQSLRYY